jgi:hypothetical protein
MKYFKSPLNIYVVYHPSFTRGVDYANYLFSEFCRDYQKPLSRGPGIPVYIRCEVDESKRPPAIDYSLAYKNAVIVLVDDYMFEDQVWSDYFRELVIDSTGNKRVFPVALSKYAYEVAPGVKQQFVRLQDITANENDEEFMKRRDKLKSELLHDFSRILLNMNASYNAMKDVSPPPVKLFISHAKIDGKNVAMDFRNYIRSETKLSSFFDANDIANGYDFEQEITAGVKNSALVVFQTDAYATREWCRIEVITAKRYKSPLVIVNSIESGEKRSFPYLGNAPSIRWNNNFDDIIDLALVQVLYNLYQELMMKEYVELYQLTGNYNTAYLTSPPELFNFIDLAKLKREEGKPVLVLYPDPPLGAEELRLLNEIDEHIIFTTPVMLPTYKI